MRHESDSTSILLVEDSQIDIDLTLLAFSRIHFTKPVKVTRDGAETLDLINQWKTGQDLPQLILMDINIPKVSGLEVLRVLKSQKLTNHIPVVMLTSSTNDAALRTAYSYGANSYIIKPVDFEKFLQLSTILCEYWLTLNVKPEDNR